VAAVLCEHRFMKTVGGITYFARVRFDVRAEGDELRIADSIPPAVNADAGEVTAATHPGWVAAALEGAREAAHLLRARKSIRGARIDLVSLIGSVVDTREDVIRCAAHAAVWTALAPHEPPPAFALTGGEWRLALPSEEKKGKS
jgi:hypothetical protein